MVPVLYNGKVVPASTCVSNTNFERLSQRCTRAMWLTGSPSAIQRQSNAQQHHCTPGGDVCCACAHADVCYAAAVTEIIKEGNFREAELIPVRQNSAECRLHWAADAPTCACMCKHLMSIYKPSSPDAPCAVRLASGRFTERFRVTGSACTAGYRPCTSPPHPMRPALPSRRCTETTTEPPAPVVPCCSDCRLRLLQRCELR